MTRTEFVSAMAPLAVNFKRELTRPTMTLFWSEFQHLRPDDFRDAVVEIIRTHKFFPTVAEMRTALGMGQGSSLSEAGAVFDALLDAGPEHDYRLGDFWTLQAVTERFGARALAAFMAAGGTRAFRDRRDKDVPFLRRDFMAGWERWDERTEPRERLLSYGTTKAPHGLAPASESLPRLLPGPAEET